MRWGCCACFVRRWFGNGPSSGNRTAPMSRRSYTGSASVSGARCSSFSALSFRFCRCFRCFFRGSSRRLFRCLGRYRLRLLFLESRAAVRAKELAFPRFAAAMLAFAHGHFPLFQSETVCSPVACKKAPVSKRHRRLAQNLWQCCQDFPFYLNICCAKPQSFRLFRALLP